MKTQHEIKREAADVLLNLWGKNSIASSDDCVTALSAAGLLVTPTLLAVWEAAKAWEYSDDSSTRAVLRDIIEAHAATLRKPEPPARYVAINLCAVEDRHTGEMLDTTKLAARLNAGTP